MLQVRLDRSKVADEDDEDEERNIEDADMFSETTSVGGSVATTTKSKSTLATRQSSRLVTIGLNVVFGEFISQILTI